MQQRTINSTSNFFAAPVYVNAPPKPRRTSNVASPLLVTGQYHQPLMEVQQAHQRVLQNPQPSTRIHQNQNYSKSLGRTSGANFLASSGYNGQANGYYGSVGRQNGTSMAPPRTPSMGRQIREQRRMQFQHQLQPQRPKSR